MPDQKAQADLRKQVEELLRLSNNRNLDWCAEVADAFPDIAQHYLALRDAVNWAYQLAGAVHAGVEPLDNLSALAQGLPAPHEWKAAWSPLLDENADWIKVTGCENTLQYSDVAEYRTVKSLMDSIESISARTSRLLDENAALLCSVKNQRGDLLCWLPDDIGLSQIPPWEEFSQSCQRFHAQVSGERGVLMGCKTIAQLEAENATLRDTQAGAIKYAAWLEERKERLEAENAALLDENENMLKDARRYRWMLKHHESIGFASGDREPECWIDSKKLSKKIDSALARADAIITARDTGSKGCFCCCGPEEPNARRAPQCPIHGPGADALAGEKP